MSLGGTGGKRKKTKRLASLEFLSRMQFSSLVAHRTIEALCRTEERSHLCNLDFVATGCNIEASSEQQSKFCWRTT